MSPIHSLRADFHVAKPPSPPIGRWAALVAALIVEVLVLTVSFDTATLAHWDSSVVKWLEHSTIAGQIAIAAVSGVFIFGGQPWRQSLESLSRAVGIGRPSRSAVIVHIACFVLLYQSTTMVFDSRRSASFDRSGLLLVWLAAVVAWLASWCTAVLPLKSWRMIVARPILGGLGLAVVAVGVGRAAQSWWRPLADATLGAVHLLLSLVYDPLILAPEERVIGTESFTVQIAAECSGYEGIGLTSVFLGVFLWWFRSELRFPHALLLLPLGIVLIWCANVLRIAMLVAIGASFSSSVGIGAFHSQAGWLMFNAVALGVVALAKRSRVFRAACDPSEPASLAVGYPAAPLLMPLLVMVATSMVCAALVDGPINLLYPVKVIVVGGTLCFFAAAYRRDRIMYWSFSWAASLIGMLVFAIWMLLEPLAGVRVEDRSAAAAELNRLGPVLAAGWIGFRALGSVVVVPLAEELAFRGYLARRLIDEDFERVPIGSFTWLSFLASAILFGGLHGRWVAGTLAGCAFGWALYRRGRLIDAVVAHATANALITAYVIATGDWTAWS